MRNLEYNIRAMSYADFIKFIHHRYRVEQWECLNGKLICTLPADKLHQYASSILRTDISFYFKDRKEKLHVSSPIVRLTSEKLDDFIYLNPDMSVSIKTSIDVPALVIEVWSDCDTIPYRKEKVEKYLSLGVQEVWEVCLDTETTCVTTHVGGTVSSEVYPFYAKVESKIFPGLGTNLTNVLDDAESVSFSDRSSPDESTLLSGIIELLQRENNWLTQRLADAEGVEVDEIRQDIVATLIRSS